MPQNSKLSTDFAARQDPYLALTRLRARISIRALMAKELSPRNFLMFSALIAVAIWAALWVYIAEFPLNYMNLDYPLSLAKAHLAAECVPNDIVVFGDSRAAGGIIPAQMRQIITNLAYPGGSPVENYFMVKRALRCPTPPRLVVIAQSAALYLGPHAFWNIFALQGILNYAQLSEVTDNAARLHDANFYQIPHPSGIPVAFLPCLYATRFPPLYFAYLLGGYGFGRRHYNLLLQQEIIASGGRISFGNAPANHEIADEAQAKSWSATPLTNLYLLRTLTLLRNRHVPVVILTMPVNQATCDHLPMSTRHAYSNYLNALSQNDRNIVYVEPSIPCWPDKYYNDNAHLNEAGAAAYTKKFANLIETTLASRPVSNEKND